MRTHKYAITVFCIAGAELSMGTGCTFDSSNIVGANGSDGFGQTSANGGASSSSDPDGDGGAGSDAEPVNGFPGVDNGNRGGGGGGGGGGFIILKGIVTGGGVIVPNPMTES